MWRWVLGAAAFGAFAYWYDVLYAPRHMAERARAAAGDKPLLNVGAGTDRSSLRVALFGPQLYGDVNCDLAETESCDVVSVCRCDAQNLPFPDKHFGAVLASHVVEHVDDPVQALREMRRVADHVFVVVPKWWAPHTWLHPGHQWYISQGGDTYSLWR